MKKFSKSASVINVSFTCPICGADVELEIEDLPVPDMSADNVPDSENSDDYDVACDTCAQDFRVEVYVNMYEGNVAVYDSNNDEIYDVDVEVLAEEDGFSEMSYDDDPYNSPEENADKDEDLDSLLENSNNN